MSEFGFINEVIMNALTAKDNLLNSQGLSSTISYFKKFHLLLCILDSSPSKHTKKEVGPQQFQSGQLLHYSVPS